MWKSKATPLALRQVAITVTFQHKNQREKLQRSQNLRGPCTASCPWTGFLKRGSPWAAGRSWRVRRSNASGPTKPWTPAETSAHSDLLRRAAAGGARRETHLYPLDAGLYPQLLHRPPGLSDAAGALHLRWHDSDCVKPVGRKRRVWILFTVELQLKLNTGNKITAINLLQ